MNIHILVLAEIDASTDLHDVWLSASGSSQYGYYLPSALLKHELKRTYSNLVAGRYPSLVDKGYFYFYLFLLI